MSRNTFSGVHHIRGCEVFWRYREVVRISRDGVIYDLYIHDCRHGGDGYTKIEDLHNLTVENIGMKLKKALDPDCDLYVLREAGE